MTPAGRRTDDQNERLAQYSRVSGQTLGALEDSLMSPRQLEEARLRQEVLQLRIDNMQRTEPSRYAKAAALVDEYIANGGEGDRQELIARALNIDSGMTEFAKLFGGSGRTQAEQAEMEALEALAAQGK